MSALNVRAQFAKHLKDIRVQRGFDRARYFAQSLGIEENRYTRYERAEVEPSLALMHKICETLRVTPNELLGYVSAKVLGRAAPGMSAAAAGAPLSQPSPVGTSCANAPYNLGSLAWRLAAEVTGLRGQLCATSHADADALATYRETAALFQQLRSAPFDTVAEILADPSLRGVGGGREAALARLIKSFTDGASSSPATTTAS